MIVLYNSSLGQACIVTVKEGSYDRFIVLVSIFVMEALLTVV